MFTNPECLRTLFGKETTVIIIAFCIATISKASDDAEFVCVLANAQHFLTIDQKIENIPLSEIVGKALPLPEQQYKLAIVLWALLQPDGPQETKESLRVENLFWASISAIGSKQDSQSKKLILSIVDKCNLKSGDLVSALEIAFRSDSKGFDAELTRRRREN